MSVRCSAVIPPPKGNKNLANGAISAANDEKVLIARGDLIYKTKRGKRPLKIPPELTGLEPATPAVTGRCSDQLSYNSRDFSENSEGL